MVVPNEPNPVAARHSGISQSRGGSQYTLGKRPKSLALPLKSQRGRRGGQFGPFEDGLRHGVIDVMIILHGTSPRLPSAYFPLTLCASVNTPTNRPVSL
jgi:hypothetical protein